MAAVWQLSGDKMKDWNLNASIVKPVPKIVPSSYTVL